MADRPLGSLFVTVAANVSKFTKGMDTVDRTSNKTRTKLRGGLLPSIQGVSGAMNVLGGFAAVEAAKAIFQLGTDVEETENKFRTILGTAAETGDAFVEAFSQMAGISETALKDTVAQTTLLGTGMGLTQEAALAMAQAATQVAGDLTSINNIPLDKTLNAITSAMVGNNEAIKSLTGPITALQVKEKALELGLISAGEALTSEARAVATLEIAADRLGPALGDMERTQDETANAGRRMEASIQDAKEALGSALLPIIDAAIPLIVKLAQTVELAVNGWQQLTTIFQRALAWIKQDDAAVAALDMKLVRLGRASEELWDTLILGSGEGGVLATTRDAVDAVTSSAREAALVFENVGKRAMPEVAEGGRMIGEIAVPAVELLGLTLEQTRERQRLMNEETERATQKTLDYANAVVGLFAAFRGGGSIFSKIGKIGAALLPLLAGPLGLGATGLGIAGLGLGALQGFARGGFIPSGGVGVVGEEGPELISGPGQITPMGGGSPPINITIVANDGRTIVDTVRIKANRDTDVRRIARIPLAAMATG